jgi:RimJ/RimL family protein N-acetyltransferase
MRNTAEQAYMTSGPEWVLETERLAFRRYTLGDLPKLIEQRSDPDVNKYLGGPERQNAAWLSERLKFYISCYDSHGFGMCPIVWKPTGEVIGSAGLQPLGETGEIEVGYSLIRRFWGMGLATEAARAWLKHGFTEQGLERIVAVTDVFNAGSRRVLEKLGMRYEKTEMHYDTECAFYAIGKAEFLPTPDER